MNIRQETPREHLWGSILDGNPKDIQEFLGLNVLVQLLNNTTDPKICNAQPEWKFALRSGLKQQVFGL